MRGQTGEENRDWVIEDLADLLRDLGALRKQVHF